MSRRVNLTLSVKNLGPIKDATIQFGDLTVLVGPQATGKSLLLQMMKFCLDGKVIVRNLDENGFQVGNQRQVLEQFLGEGMGDAWSTKTALSFSKRPVKPASLALKKPREMPVVRPDDEIYEKVFYIPAQRSLALADGWPRLFSEFQVPPPYVLRRYSQSLHNILTNRTGRDQEILFPVVGEIQNFLREHIDESIFHGGKLFIDQSGLRRQLKLDYGHAKPSYSSWTAGQREFIPLLVALYFLSSWSPSRSKVEYVVLEEPEMGLHPRAILSVMLVVLDLLFRGYRVAISTHSPLVLDVVWALGRLKQWKDWVKPADVLKLFGDISTHKLTRPIAQAALTRDYRVFYLDDHDGMGVTARDISKLDPGADEEWMAGWGGLTGVSSHISNIVGQIAARADDAENA